MRGRLYLDIMYVNCANLIMQYLLIRWFNLETGHTVVTIRISRSFLWYAMNELMHVMQPWFLGYMDGHFSHHSWLNHRCKIECLQDVFKKWLCKKKKSSYAKIEKKFCMICCECSNSFAEFKGKTWSSHAYNITYQAFVVSNS